ncbi:hypothetical protein V1514DRAFT_351694 [Lipomyces japonicus]|uniref:uncharacterized protein n=1 Tax=Lipomyces japonicus TaxID=56871 RepID=UPI0034CE0B13
MNILRTVITRNTRTSVLRFAAFGGITNYQKREFHLTTKLNSHGKILNQAKPIEASRGGPLQDFDMLQDLPRPPIAIDEVNLTGFLLSNGDVFDCENNTRACLINGAQVLVFKFEDYVTGLDTGIVSISNEGLGFFDVIFPRPELVLIGLGTGSRILSEETRTLFLDKGCMVEVGDTVNAASNFELLATERPHRISALLLPPSL